MPKFPLVQLKSDGITFLLAAVALLVIFLPFFSSQAYWGSGTDLAVTYFPMRAYMGECLRNGQWPLWNPYFGVGLPMQTGIRSISNPAILLTLLFSPAFHVKATLYLHSLLSAGFFACFLTRLGLSRWAGLTAGLAYAISGFGMGRIYAGHLDWTEILPYLPLCTWMGWNAIRLPGVGWTLLWGGGLALLTISGHYQFVHMAGFSLILLHAVQVLMGLRHPIPRLNYRQPFASSDWVGGPELVTVEVVRGQRWSDSKRLVGRWLLAGVICILVSAFQVLPAVESLANTNRLAHSETFNSEKVPPVFWLTALLPGFFDLQKVVIWWSKWPNAEAQMYLGVATLGLAALGLRLCSWRAWAPPLLVALAAAWLSLGSGFGLHDWLQQLDPVVYSNFRAQCRWGIIFAFYGAWLAALGVDRLRVGKTWLALLFPGLPLLAVLFWLFGQESDPQGWSLFVQRHAAPELLPLLANSPGEYLQLILGRAFSGWQWSALACLLLWAVGLLPRSSRASAAFCLLTLELALAFRPYLVMAPESALRIPAPVAEVLSQQVGSQRVMWNPRLGWLDHGMMYAFSEVSFLDSCANPAMVKALNLVEGRPISLAQLYMEPWSSHPFWDLQGAAIVVNDRAAPPWPGLLPVAPEMGIYRNPKAFPRVFMTGATEWVPDAEQALRRLVADPGLAARVTLVQGPQPAPPSGPQPEYALQELKLQTNRVWLRVTNRGAGMLVLSDAWWPGWHVRVDGQAQLLYRLNGSLHRGVWLQPGSHEVEFYYWPKTLTGGLWLSGITCLGLGLWLIPAALKR
jgi:hypothetical protein